MVKGRCMWPGHEVYQLQIQRSGVLRACPEAELTGLVYISRYVFTWCFLNIKR